MVRSKLPEIKFWSGGIKTTITRKISETNSSFHAKYRTTGKV